MEVRRSAACSHRLGITSTFTGGLRVTSPEAMAVVRMVLVGQVGRELVGALNQHGPFAVGLSGEDAGLFTVERTTAVVDGMSHDIGLVGDVVSVRPEAVLDLIEAGRIPVVATVAPDENGLVHNVNADTAAAVLATALGAREARRPHQRGRALPRLPRRTLDIVTTIDAGQLASILPTLCAGMIPKMGACLRAVENGVPNASVIDGRIPHSLLLELLTDQGIGTMVGP